jgi:hypothetical protein
MYVVWRLESLVILAQTGDAKRSRVFRAGDLMDIHDAPTVLEPSGER